VKKSELKNGIVIKYRNNDYKDSIASEYALVVDNLFIGLDGFMPLISYNEDLTFSDDKDYDIVAVYEVDGFGNGLRSVLSGNDLTLLWEEGKNK